ncbi:MAG: hypothetical protein P794_08815 [Epsilonproteobacteria bacterium (ex Lamellibrachia satsuma)]|nr:MAG: hypothetical protein P794_08815 [Epsilonproteobacteria bacterium (ex Lamellibrachia satsuma)]
MKDETQATHLAKMMQKHKLYPEYELALPFMKVKKSALKKLSKEDILLVGFDHLEMILLSEGEICADVIMDEAENSRKIKIIDTAKRPIYTNNSKKYDIVKCSFGLLQSRKLEAGHKIDAAPLNLQKVTLAIDDKNIAKGSLAVVDDEIAIKIDKVMR